MLSVMTNTETPENLRYCWYSIFYASDMVEGGIKMWEKWLLSFMDGPFLLVFAWAFLTDKRTVARFHNMKNQFWAVGCGLG